MSDVHHRPEPDTDCPVVADCPVVVVDVPVPRSIRLREFRRQVGEIAADLRLLLNERSEIIEREVPRLWDRLNHALVESEPGDRR